MPRLPYQVVPAPAGMDCTNNPASTPPNKAQRIQNFLCDRAGYLRATLLLSNIKSDFPSGIDGIASWYDTDGNAELLVVSGGSLWRADLTAKTTATGWSVVGSGFTLGKIVRSVGYRQETIFVQEGGINPLRYNGDKLFLLGVPAPTVALSALPGVPSGGATGAKIGTISYLYTNYDELGRESDPSPVASVNFTTYTGKSAYLTRPTWTGEPIQIHGSYLYANTSGGSVYYRIKNLVRPFVSWEDNSPDNTVNTGTNAPLAGMNTAPNPASCIAIQEAKGHIFLNDTTNKTILQVNNIDAPTKWATVYRTSADGLRINAVPSQNNQITAMAAFGSLLGVWSRSGFMQLWGDDVTNYTLRDLHETGTLATDSAKRCDNVLLCLDTAGQVSSYDYAGGFNKTVISQEIENDLKGFTEAERQAAFAEYVDNRYLLSIGDTTYIYDFRSQGWTTLQLEG
jgi:hypothetical protein